MQPEHWWAVGISYGLTVLHHEIRPALISGAKWVWEKLPELVKKIPSREAGVRPAKRPDWDTIWMDFAGSLALRSTCRRASVGCVVVSMDNTSVLGLGYNGGPRGLKNDCLSDVPGQCGHLHAEINALIKTNYHDEAKKKVYLTLSPCYNCAVALVNAGVLEVIYRDAYRDTSALKLFDQAGVRVRQFSPARLPARDLYLDQDRKA